MVTRRAFVVGLIALGAGPACAPEQPTGLRGVGTVLREPSNAHGDGDTAAGADQHAPGEPSPTPTPQPLLTATPTVVPTVEEHQPAVGNQPPGTTYAQAHVLPATAGRPPVAPLPPRRVVIPSLGLDTKVIPLGTYVAQDGSLAWETAPFAIGHHRGTAGPGQVGNMVLSGHISSPGEGAVFKHLPEIQVGQGVIVSTEERQHLYRVTEIRTVLPSEVTVMAQTRTPTATLITCVPDRIYSHRLIVSAELV